MAPQTTESMKIVEIGFCFTIFLSFRRRIMFFIINANYEEKKEIFLDRTYWPKCDVDEILGPRSADCPFRGGNKLLNEVWRNWSWRKQNSTTNSAKTCAGRMFSSRSKAELSLFVVTHFPTLCLRASDEDLKKCSLIRLSQSCKNSFLAQRETLRVTHNYFRLVWKGNSVENCRQSENK